MKNVFGFGIKNFIRVWMNTNLQNKQKSNRKRKSKFNSISFFQHFKMENGKCCFFVGMNLILF